MSLEWFDVKNEKNLLKRTFSAWGAYGLSGDISSDGIDNDGDGLLMGKTIMNLVIHVNLQQLQLKK